jgi:hypothetical protein
VTIEANDFGHRPVGYFIPDRAKLGSVQSNPILESYNFFMGKWLIEDWSLVLLPLIKASAFTVVTVYGRGETNLL